MLTYMGCGKGSSIRCFMTILVSLCGHRFHKVYDSLYNLCLEEDCVQPEKYLINNYPPMSAFPADHPNRVLNEDSYFRDEL